MINIRMQAIALALAFAASSFGATPTSSLDALVAANYPRTLTNRATRDHYVDARQQKYVVVGTKSEQFIVAAYSNGQVGAVALLAQQTNTSTLLDSAPFPFLGSAPDVWLRDLDGDDSPEVLVQFDIGKGGAQTWAFKIVDRRLQLLTSVDKHLHTTLTLPDFISMGDGCALDIGEAVNLGSLQDPDIHHLHFALQNGRYTEVAPLDFFDIFYRESGTPQTKTVDVDLASDELDKPYRLVISNGGQSGADYRVSSGEVRVNGVLVSGSSDFGQNRAAWTIPVSLQQHNVISIRLEGKPGGRIAVAIRHD
jgi:hypothetical protein